MKAFKILFFCFLLSTFFSITTQFTNSAIALQANYPLEIIQPQEELDTSNRFYKAYPGLKYNVRLGVIGGLYPYHFELLDAPEGMTIDEFRGEITWKNPTEAGTPHSVSIRVTDSESTHAKVSWTITVTTDGFRFLDAINGTPADKGGDGSIENPWKSIADFYETKNTSTYAKDFLYFREGTYDTIDAPVEDGIRLAIVSNNKPNVWIAYPDENPVINVEGSFLCFYGKNDNLYFDGLEFKSNTTNHQLQFHGGTTNNVVIRNNIFDMNNSPGSWSNTSHIMTRTSPSGIFGQYWSIQDNIGRNINNGYWLLGYFGKKVIVENNIVHNIAGHPISPKSSNQMWFIRGNHIYESSGSNNDNGINVQYGVNAEIPAGDIEISYNLVDTGGARAFRGGDYGTMYNDDIHGLPVYVFRNTFIGSSVSQYNVNEYTGPWHYYNNVIINNAEGISSYNIEYPDNLIIENNLTGNIYDNIVDEKGYLTEEYLKYVNMYGHQIIYSSVQELSPPAGLRFVDKK